MSSDQPRPSVPPNGYPDRPRLLVCGGRDFTDQDFIYNTLLNLKLANNAAADGLGGGTDSKALVCLFLSGGIDSYQMLVPWEQSRYNSYATTRGAFGTDGGLALNRDTLLRLNGTASDFALHPSMAGLHQMATGTGAFAQLEEVIVTATKRESALLETPASISAWLRSNPASPTVVAAATRSQQKRSNCGA